MMLQNNKSDLDLLLAMRYDNGADFWATPDGHLGIEKPVSTLTALMIISELNIRADHEVVRGDAGLYQVYDGYFSELLDNSAPFIHGSRDLFEIYALEDALPTKHMVEPLPCFACYFTN